MHEQVEPVRADALPAIALQVVVREHQFAREQRIRQQGPRARCLDILGEAARHFQCQFVDPEAGRFVGQLAIIEGGPLGRLQGDVRRIRGTLTLNRLLLRAAPLLLFGERIAGLRRREREMQRCPYRTGKRHEPARH
ncbi:hypothetical protein MJ435_03475, partial [Burkholderia gladioli]